MSIALIDAGGANLGSVRYALARLGVQPRLVRDADELRGTSHAILPGVGAAAQAMSLLRARGFDDALRRLETPLLGICLGMQLLFEWSEEGDVPCLGLLPGKVRRLHGTEGVRIPHMGWNRLHILAQSPLLDGIDDGAQAYFVHGYAVDVGRATIAETEHGGVFSAIVADGLRFGAQFHPERSSATGQRLLYNFLRTDTR